MDPVHWSEQNVNNVELGIIHYQSTKTFQQFLIVNIILKKKIHLITNYQKHM